MNKKSKTLKSVHLKSQSGTRLDIPKYKVMRKSKQRSIKQFNIKRENYKSKRHNEIEYNKKTFNCITSCNVIKIVQQDCQKGLFAALCIKCALCMKDIEMRLLESKRTPNDIKQDTYDIYHRSKIIDNKFILPTNRNIYVYIPLHKLKIWNDISELLKLSWISKLYNKFNPNNGFWAKFDPKIIDKMYNVIYTTQIDNNKFPKTKQNLVNFKNDLSIGKHIVNKQLIYFNFSEKDYKNSWLIALKRVFDCLSQVKKGYETCRPNNMEIQNITKIVNSIFNSNHNQINWNKLANSFMGGLFEYEHDNNNIKTELALLEDLHHLNNLKSVKIALKDYIDNIK